jgi:BolA protein
MTIAETINDKIVDQFQPIYLDVINESDNHNVPPGSESHFKLVVVSETFTDKTLIQRHREINKLLADQLAGQVHALSLHTHTPSEWQERGGSVPASPPCRGGSAKS